METESGVKSEKKLYRPRMVIAGKWQQESISRKVAAEKWQQESISRKVSAGKWQQETGSQNANKD